MTRGVEGVEGDAVTRWLADRVEVEPPVTFAVITGGRSNLTYSVTDAAGRRWVLRRPPLHSVLSSAHDVVREARLIGALADTDVPVPPLIGSESDTDVTGAPFFVMRYVDGLVPRDADVVVAELDVVARRRMGEQLADTLAALHAVDVDAVGLGDLAPREDYLARQLRRWRRQYEQGSTRDLPAAIAVHERLAADIPAQHTSTIVHGDYRLDNVIVDGQGTIRAVLDWELCTLGDPLADVGLLAVYWDPGGPRLPMIPAAGRIPGMPPLDDVLARYATVSGREMSTLDYHVAFGYWKLAMILEGVYARSASGAYGDAGSGYEAFGAMVVDLLDLADAAATRAGR
jgi:aminoglycoside phosphotransferase (APT) family kinase protein